MIIINDDENDRHVELPTNGTFHHTISMSLMHIYHIKYHIYHIKNTTQKSNQN